MTKLQEYTPVYKEEVASLILTIQKTEFEIPVTLEQQPDLNDITNFYQSNNGNFWMALVNDKVVGTIALLDIGNGQGALRKMFVDAEYRGKQSGIGQKLLNNLFDWAKQKQFKEIFLGTTAKFLAAQRFYEKNGFIEIAKDTLPAAFPIMAVDVKFYKYSLSH